MSLTIDHKLLVESAFKLPPLPQSALRLMNLLSEKEPDLRAIVKVIECDPALTLKVLRVANSAVGATRYEVGTVQKAVLRLGTGTVAGYVIESCVRPMTGKRIPGYDLAEEDFWHHSLAVAVAAESIQAHSPKWSNTLAFTAGLLHDIGKLIVGQYLDSESIVWLERAITEGKQPAFAAETEILSLHHGEAGGIIAQHWGLPESLVKGIAYHHEPEKGGDGVCFATYLANQIAHRLEQGSSHENGELADTHMVRDALDWLEISGKNFATVRNDVRRALDSMSGQSV